MHITNYSIGFGVATVGGFALLHPSVRHRNQHSGAQGRCRQPRHRGTIYPQGFGACRRCDVAARSSCGLNTEVANTLISIVMPLLALGARTERNPARLLKGIGFGKRENAAEKSADRRLGQLC